MKEILVKQYQCEFCKKIFQAKWECRFHEETEHKCPKCEHSYYVYGCELNCQLKNKNKKCKFKERI